MLKPLQITFRGMEQSSAVEAQIRERMEKLEQVCGDIIGCQVIVEASHRRHHQGNLYHVGIDVTLPKGELVVNRSCDQHHAHEDLYVAVRDAFNAMRRQLEGRVERRRGHVKSHEVPPHGHIRELNPDEDYGRIETADGREVYFHRNSVVNGNFDRLRVGDTVRYSEEPGELGPQASTVHVEGKRHVVG